MDEVTVFILAMIMLGLVMFLLIYFTDKDWTKKTDNIDNKPQKVQATRRIWLGKGVYFEVYESTTKREPY